MWGDNKENNYNNHRQSEQHRRLDNNVSQSQIENNTVRKCQTQESPHIPLQRSVTTICVHKSRQSVKSGFLHQKISVSIDITSLIPFTNVMANYIVHSSRAIYSVLRCSSIYMYTHFVCVCMS